jgi:hypothetical protein
LILVGDGDASGRDNRLAPNTTLGPLVGGLLLFGPRPFRSGAEFAHLVRRRRASPFWPHPAPIEPKKVLIRHTLAQDTDQTQHSLTDQITVINKQAL